MFKKLFYKYFITCAAVILISYIVLSFSVFRIMSFYTIRDKKNMMHQTITDVAARFPQFYSNFHHRLDSNSLFEKVFSEYLKEAANKE